MTLRLPILGLAHGMFGDILRNEQSCSQYRIWLHNLAKCLPSSLQLNGFDISAKRCPGVLLKTVTLQIADALQNPPSELIEE